MEKSDTSILKEKDKEVLERKIMRIMEKWFKNRESGQSKKKSREKEGKDIEKRIIEGTIEATLGTTKKIEVVTEGNTLEKVAMKKEKEYTKTGYISGI